MHEFVVVNLILLNLALDLVEPVRVAIVMARSMPRILNSFQSRLIAYQNLVPKERTEPNRIRIDILQEQRIVMQTFMDASRVDRSV